MDPNKAWFVDGVIAGGPIFPIERVGGTGSRPVGSVLIDVERASTATGVESTERTTVAGGRPFNWSLLSEERRPLLSEDPLEEG